MPKKFSYLWSVFEELNIANSLTFTGINDWCQLRKTSLQQWELDALIATKVKMTEMLNA